MKKRFLALVLSIVTVLSITGCDTNKNTKTNDTNDTTQVSEEKKDSKEFLSYFPEKIEFDNSKLVCINNSMSVGGETLDISITTGHKDLDTYMSFVVKNAFDFRMLTREKDSYAYLDMYSSLKSMMTDSDLEKMKEEYAKEKGVDVSEVTSEEFENFIREKTIFSGYTDLSLDNVDSNYDMSFDENSLESIKSAYLDEEKVNTLLASYDKEQLNYASETDELAIAIYNANGFKSPIEVAVNKKTKEVSCLKFSYDTNGIACDIEVTFDEFNLAAMDIQWATHETKTSVEEVSENMMMALMMLTMGKAQ